MFNNCKFSLPDPAVDPSHPVIKMPVKPSRIAGLLIIADDTSDADRITRADFIIVLIKKITFEPAVQPVFMNELTGGQDQYLTVTALQLAAHFSGHHDMGSFGNGALSPAERSTAWMPFRQNQRQAHDDKNCSKTKPRQRALSFHGNSFQITVLFDDGMTGLERIAQIDLSAV